MRRIPFFFLEAGAEKFPRERRGKICPAHVRAIAKRQDRKDKKKKRKEQKSSLLSFFLLVLRALGEFGLCSDTVQGLQASSSSAGYQDSTKESIGKFLSQVDKARISFGDRPHTLM